MGKVIVDITMSLDGFVTGPNDGPGNGLGDGGRILHEWVFAGRTDADTQLLEEPMKTLGSGVLGRRTFDIAEAAWGDNPPMFGQVFVLTHRPHEPLTRGPATFIFVTDGPMSALSQARAAAGDKNIALMGANISQRSSDFVVVLGRVELISALSTAPLKGGFIKITSYSWVSLNSLERVSMW